MKMRLLCAAALVLLAGCTSDPNEIGPIDQARRGSDSYPGGVTIIRSVYTSPTGGTNVYSVR